jgi:hypothetical protein
MAKQLAPVLSYASWFRSARLGMSSFELLARGSGCFVHGDSEGASFAHAVVSAHVAAPQRFRHYFPQGWLQYVRDIDCRHVLEFRTLDGALRLAWPVHRIGPGGATLDRDVPAALEDADASLRIRNTHLLPSSTCVPATSAGAHQSGIAGAPSIAPVEVLVMATHQRTSADLQLPREHAPGDPSMVVFHPAGHDVAMLRIRDPPAMIASLGAEPHSYGMRISTEQCASPAPGVQVQLSGWEQSQGQGPEELDAFGKAALYYTERRAVLCDLHPSLRLSTHLGEACAGRHMIESNERLEWGLCGAPVVEVSTLSSKAAANAEDADPRLIGILEGRCKWSSSHKADTDLGRFGILICARHIRALLLATRSRA